MTAKEELIAFIKAAREEKLAIMCVGNDLRGDDGLGPLIADEIIDKIDKNILLLNTGSQPEYFLTVLVKNKITHCLIIDAVEFQDEPGAIGFFDPKDLQEYQVTFSTHYMGMKLLIDTFEKNTGAKFKVLGIQPINLEFGATMSKEILISVEKLIKFLLDYLS